MDSQLPDSSRPQQVSHLGPRFQAFLENENCGLGASCLRFVMAPLAAAYGTISTFRLSQLEREGHSSQGLPIPVISVGNLVVGGTGKTPFVRMLCRKLLARGERPLVLGRGYGAKAQGVGLDEEGASLVRDVPGIQVAQGKDRFLAAQPHLQGSSAATVAVLDDGAQALRHRRDLDVHLIDASRPFGSGWPLPAGSLREWRSGHSRADILVATRSERLSADERLRLQNQIKNLGLVAPLLWAEHRPLKLIPGSQPPGSLRARRVFAVSGIARPQSFIDSLTQLGAQVVGSEAFKDHHAFDAHDIEVIEAKAERLGAQCIVATGKDAPKVLPHSASSGKGIEWICLEVDLWLSPEDHRRLNRALDEVLSLRDHGRSVIQSGAAASSGESSS